MLLRIFALIILFFSLHVNANEKYKFAIVPKTIKSDFFDEVRQGCSQAARELNVECIYKGSTDANPISQINILKELIEQKVDGIAVSVIDSHSFSKYKILQMAKDANIPIITFDSDVDLESCEDKRLSYVGTNNFALGMALGEELKKKRPQGGTLCIQSGWKSSINLNQRIQGIRYALFGNENINKAKNINGWSELNRCPLYSRDNPDLALYQLLRVLNDVDAFIAVGGWSQYAKDYKRKIRPYLYNLQKNKKTLIIADTTQSQINLLRDKLSFINIGQNPYMMGKISIYTLNKIKENREYKKIIYTPLTYCTQENYETCTKLK